MKLTNINPHNVEHLAPAWIIDPFLLAKMLDEHLDSLFRDRPKLKPKQWDKSLRFWVEVIQSGDGWNIRAACPSGKHERVYCGQVIVSLENRSLCFPLNAVLKGSDDLAGLHCIYMHSILCDCPLSYIGVSGRRWFDRYAEHRRAAEQGSHFIFHAALRDHAEKAIQHRVLVAGISHGTSMSLEEEFVENLSLYPRGLNLIPGGFAGIRYLSSLGITARNAAERDEQVEALAARENVDGKPNPLCAARWASDQDFVNRVICGHSGRLTVAQVRQIRMHASFGREFSDVADVTGSSVSQVKRVLSGDAYGRIK